MKKYSMLVMLSGMLMFSACSQELPISDVPSVVINTFSLEFPNAKDVEWEKNGDVYEVEYEVDNRDMEALIGKKGNLVKYKQELEFQELPQTLKSSLQTQYSGKIDDLHLLVVEDREYYQVEVEGRLTSSHKILDASGEEVRDVPYYK